MWKTLLGITVIIVLLPGPLYAQAKSGMVQVTPLGSHHGEFCRLDRALVFEDPNGTRILYDPGRTVAGADDPRLGNIDVVLVSHVHGDHIGDRHTKQVNEGSCATPDSSVDSLPISSAVQIAVAKKAKILTGSEMPRFIASRMKLAGGNADDSLLVRFGGSKTLGGVTFTTVPAVHSNGLAAEFIGGTLGESMRAAGITAYVGPPTGYVVTFSNGLVTYLSGDTGITAEQERVVRDHYGAKLVVINIGDTFTTGPDEAAYVINRLIRPAAVIASHANEQATRNGKVLPDTRTQRFIDASRVPVHLPLSGKTMAFDGNGRCVSGC